MKRSTVIILAVLVLAAGYIYRFQPDLLNSWETRVSGALSGEIQSSALLPPPLRGALDEANAHLTREGVIIYTNHQRGENGALPPLHENTLLDHAAEIKLQDMFDRQYFEHVSPSGRGPSDLANQVGYKYVLVGENLALGNFKDDQTLVAAWMDSPGHRANILNTRYQEIGVAVGRGMFEGRETWLAVQEFGLPLSSCPQPSASLKSQIDANQRQIDQLEADLAVRKADMDSKRYDNATYNRKVEEYNREVNELNALINETKQLVSQYNLQINQFNNCLEG
jgi:cysteine-rich secretory family protein